jgi:lysozyme
MAYQMGVEGVCGFKTMLRCLEAGELEKAAGAALNSRWAKVQTPARAKRVAAMIRGE